MSIRILVADDEPNQLELLTYNLTQADFEVIRAEDARGDHAQQEGGPVADHGRNTDKDQALGERRA